jgi:hypothetical protein
MYLIKLSGSKCHNVTSPTCPTFGKTLVTPERSEFK